MRETSKKKDPIPRLYKKLTGMGLLTEQEGGRIQEAAKLEMEQAFDFAQTSPYPDPEETFTDVYA